MPHLRADNHSRYSPTPLVIWVFHRNPPLVVGHPIPSTSEATGIESDAIA
jgi:hypothetical protein